MDLQAVYRDQIPYESDVLLMQLDAREGLGLFAKDIIGGSTAIAGLACVPTSPASLAVKVGPGRIYTLGSYLQADLGKLLGTGGVSADTAADHQILLQGLHRDTETFAMAAPVTVGQSINYLIEAQLVEADATPTVAQFYNTADPNTPISQSVSPGRTTRCVLQVKTGASAATGTQVTPTVDAGWVPVWVVTVAYGATTIISGNIVQHGSAPLLSIGGSAVAPGSQAFTSSGSFTVPAGVTNLKRVTLVGGGGGASTGLGGTGGSGAISLLLNYAVTPGQVITTTVGGAGASNAFATPGTAGGNTTFGPATAQGAPGASAGSGPPGAASGGSLNANGNYGFDLTSNVVSAPGGASQFMGYGQGADSSGAGCTGGLILIEW